MSWTRPPERSHRSCFGAGEPLMSPCFDEIASTLHERGYRVGIVTNGTLLDRHAETVPYCLDKIYVSVDGPEQLHDSIRGREHSGRSGESACSKEGGAFTAGGLYGRFDGGAERATEGVFC